jgi:hypothetical protein
MDGSAGPPELGRDRESRLPRCLKLEKPLVLLRRPLFVALRGHSAGHSIIEKNRARATTRQRLAHSFGDVAGSDDGRRKGRNRKAQRNGQRRSKFTHLV